MKTQNQLLQTENIETRMQRIFVEYGLQDEWWSLHAFMAEAEMPVEPQQRITDGYYVFFYAGNVNKEPLVAVQDAPPEKVVITTERPSEDIFCFAYLNVASQVIFPRSRAIITESGDVYIDPKVNTVQHMVENAKRYYDEHLKKSSKGV